MKKILAVILSVFLITSVFIPAPLALADSPADVIDRIEIDDVTFIENTSGYLSGGEGEQYWHYASYSTPFTVFYKDGDKQSAKGGIQIGDSWYNLNIKDNQEAEHWYADNTYTVTGSIGDKEDSFNIKVISNPIERIEAENTSVYENEGGVWSNPNPNKAYYIYRYYYPTVTVYFKDKTVKKITHDTGLSINDNWYSLNLSSNPSQSDNHWMCGETYTATVSLVGISADFNVAVRKRPDFDYFNQDGGVIITRYNGSGQDIEVPAEIEDKPVIGINGLKYGINSVTIPASVKFLSESTFYDSNLKNIFVSEDNECYADIDGVLTNKAKTKILVYPLGKGNTYTIPAGILDVSVFDDWHYENVSIIFDESQFTNIDGVLYTKDMKTVVKCKTEVSGSYTMPDTVTEIVPKAFADCDKITDVKISSNVTEITYAAFSGCTGMTSIDLPEGLTSIGESAFLNSGLTSVDIPNGVTSVCYFAFYGCENLESVGMPEGITEIQGGTFSRCTSLKSITVPSKVTDIGHSAFSFCNSLNKVDLPAGLKNIYYNAFFCCSSLSKINLPNELERIGSMAFDSTGLTSVDIPDSVNCMDWAAFRNCTNLKSAKIGKGLSYISNEVFLNCSELESIIIPENIECIYSYAFSGCSSLKTVDFKNDDILINDYAFSGCDLTNTKLPKRLKALNSGVLMGTNIENIEIPNTVTDIVYRSLGYCEKLTSIYIPSSVTKIGDYVLCGCTGLNSITVDKDNEKYYDENNCIIEAGSKTLIAGCKNSIIPADGSVTSIAEGAFGDLTNLASITIPAAITNIGYDSFAGCGGLESITVDENNTVYHSDGNCLIDTKQKTIIRGCINSKIPADGSVTRIGYGAFSHCAELTSIVIPDAITSIYWDAFFGSYNIKDVYYTGTEEQREKAYLGYNIDELENATWHYNCNPDNPTCEHTATETINAKTATCTTEGYSGDVCCKKCGWCITKGEGVPVTGHKYAWKITRLATAEKSGLKEEVCSYCGKATGRSEEIAYTGHITGDTNGDNQVNNKDLVRLFQYLSDWDVEVSEAALDVNGDGSVNNKDITRLFQFLSDWAVEIF